MPASATKTRKFTEYLKRVLRPPADRVRRFLVGGIHLELTALNAKLELVGEALDAKQALLETRLALLEKMQSNLDDIGLKVRGPLAIDEATFAVRTADGYVLVPRSDERLLVLLADAPAGGLEPGTRVVLLRLLEPDMTFVDVGANVGLHTLAAARKVGRGGHIYAFEPTPATFECLRRAIMINELGHVVDARMLAVGAVAERRRFFLQSVCGHNSIYRTSSDKDSEVLGSIEVDVATLDALIPPSQSIDLVKIDVEGSELNVLAGMTRIIADNPDIAIVAEFGANQLQRAGVTAAQWFREFEALGFLPHTIEEQTGHIKSVRHTDVADLASVNIAFVKSHQMHRLS